MNALFLSSFLQPQALFFIFEYKEKVVKQLPPLFQASDPLAEGSLSFLSFLLSSDTFSPVPL